MLVRKFKAPLLALLRQGMTPADLALALGAGCAIAAVPVFGTATLLSASVAGVMRLNQVAIQLAHYAATPLQLIFFIPFVRAGEAIFMRESVAARPADVLARFNADWAAALGEYAAAIGAATFVWAVVAIPMAWILSRLLRPVIARMMRNRLLQHPAGSPAQPKD